MSLYVIYHKSCLDGMASAHVVHQAICPRSGQRDNVFYLPWDYTHPETLPVCHKGDVFIIVDFSFSAQALVDHFKEAERVIVIDHHEDAVDKLNAYFKDHPLPDNLELVLDTEYSGAGLTWKHWFGDEPMPDLVKHVQDLDLWQFKLPNTREYIERLTLEPMTLEAYDAFNKLPYDTIVSEGLILVRKMHAQLEYHLIHNLVMVEFEQYIIPLLNVPRYLTSEVGNALAPKHPFVLLYFDVGPIRHYSLRSQKGPDQIDVAEIARRYNGNGHPNAAGFKTPVDQCIVNYL